MPRPLRQPMPLRRKLVIGEWGAEAPQELLAPLGARQAWPGGRYLAPHVP